jgi:DnaJ homolog subfamily B member 4
MANSKKLTQQKSITMAAPAHRQRQPLPRILLAFLLFVAVNSETRFDPYKVLGVPKQATNEEIRQSYRKLCLQYHPDKNVNKSANEQQRCEDLFKQVQKANEQIGDPEARRRYESISIYSSPFTTQAGRPDPTDMYREFFSQSRQYARRSPPTTPLYFNGVDISQMFSAGRPGFLNPGNLKSTYVQKVKVPLQDLFAGKKGMTFSLNNDQWQRFRAAFRGGIAKPLLYQALIYASPIVRILGLPLALLAGAAIFQSNLPHPSIVDYNVNLESGWKGGTKLTFTDVEPGFDVTFIIEEEVHERFVRVGNDLLTTITVERLQARNGCFKRIEPLDEIDAPIYVELKPNQVLQSGQQITIPGKGWPDRRRKGKRGDLLVTVTIVPDSKRKRSSSR